MKLTATVVETLDREILGTVNETEGLVELRLNSVNLTNTNTAVWIDLVLKNGKITRVWCSKAVSAGLRAKTITQSNLYGFPIVQATNKTGVEYYRVEMPEGTAGLHTISVMVKNLTVANFVPSVVSYEELIAL